MLDWEDGSASDIGGVRGMLPRFWCIVSLDNFFWRFVGMELRFENRVRVTIISYSPTP